MQNIMKFLTISAISAVALSSYTVESFTTNKLDKMFNSKSRECGNKSYSIQCLNNSTCINGRCICQDGWIGDDCKNKCPKNFYGKDCQNRCPELKNERTVCDHVTGLKCLPGYTGTDCNDICPPGTYGENCSNYCYTISQSNISGKCYTCFFMFQFNFISCTNKCHFLKNQLDTCHHITGEFECMPGYTGLHCEDTCPKGFYGEKCLSKCQNPYETNSTTGDLRSSCNHITGAYEFETRDTGAESDKIYPEGTYEENCLKICPLCNTTLNQTEVVNECMEFVQCLARCKVHMDSNIYSFGISWKFVKSPSSLVLLNVFCFMFFVIIFVGIVNIVYRTRIKNIKNNYPSYQELNIENKNNTMHSNFYEEIKIYEDPHNYDRLDYNRNS